MQEPKKSLPNCCFRESILIGHCEKPWEEVERILYALSNEWIGSSYNLISRYSTRSFLLTLGTATILLRN